MNHLRVFFTNTSTRTIGLVFFIHAIMFGSWIARIPETKATLQLGEGELGFSLLGMSIGALIAMPFVPNFMNKIGTGNATFYSLILCSLFFITPVFANSIYLLFCALFMAGVMAGANDVAMNAAAATLEKDKKVSIMSSCHGMFSLGGVVGAGIGSVLAGFGVTPQFHLLVMGILAISAAFLLRPQILRMPDSETDGESFTLPKLPVLGIAIIGFCIMLGEGAVADWSAVYLRETLNSSLFLAGMGFAGFCATMTIGRFFGDAVVPELGAKKVVSVGSLLGAIGLLIAVLTSNPLIAILGFTIVGIGFSCVVPILFRAAANIPGIAAGSGVASVTTSGIVGMLSGPPVVGIIAESYGLSTSLGMVAGLALLGFLLALKVRL